MGSIVGVLFSLVKPRIWKGQDQVLETLALLASKCEKSVDLVAPRSSWALQEARSCFP